MFKNSFRRRLYLYEMISRWQLYPSGAGVLHGVRRVEKKGRFLRLETNCNITIKVKNSKRGRAARWLRNRLYRKACQRCGISKKLHKAGF